MLSTSRDGEHRRGTLTAVDNRGRGGCDRQRLGHGWRRPDRVADTVPGYAAPSHQSSRVSITVSAAVDGVTVAVRRTTRDMEDRERAATGGLDSPAHRTVTVKVEDTDVATVAPPAVTFGNGKIRHR